MVVSIAVLGIDPRIRLTIDSEVTEGGASSPLYLNVGALEEEEDRLESISINFTDI